MSFSAHHILPVSSSTNSDPLSSPLFGSVALSGPLPVSSLLHLALHHLRSLEQDTALLSRAKRPRVLVLSPDQTALQNALREENDASLEVGHCDSELVRLLDDVEIKYLPTAAHFTYFLVSFYGHRGHRPAADAFVQSGEKIRPDPSYLPVLPTMVILHNPSAYLQEPSNQGGGLEAYGSMLALFMSTFQPISTPPPLLVLHDGEAVNLTLPVVEPHRLKKPRQRVQGLEEDADPGERIGLLDIASLFFDFVGTVDSAPQSPSGVLDGTYKHFQLAVASAKPKETVDGTSVVDFIVQQMISAETGLPGLKFEPISW